MSFDKHLEIFKEAILHLKQAGLHVYPMPAEYHEDEHLEINMQIMPKFEYKYRSAEDEIFKNVDRFFSVENFENKKINLGFDTFKGFAYLSNFLCDKLESQKTSNDSLNLIWDLIKNCTITATIQNIPSVFGGETSYKFLLFSRAVGLDKTLKLINDKPEWVQPFFNDEFANLPTMNYFFKKSNFLKNINDEKIEDKIKFLQIVKEKSPLFLVAGKDSNHLLFLTKFLDGNEEALSKISKDFPFINRYLDNIGVDAVDIKTLEKKDAFDCSFLSYSQLKNITVKEKKSINIDTRFDKITVLVNEFKFLNDLGYQKLNIVKATETDSVILCLLKSDSFKENKSEIFKNFILENILSENFSQDLFNKKLLDLHLKKKLENKPTAKLNKI